MAHAAQRQQASIDVSDPQLYQDDTWRPLFEQLRRDDPVHYCEASRFGPYWSVTRYDDIFAVELDHENYSSSSELAVFRWQISRRGRSAPASSAWTRRAIPRSVEPSHRSSRRRTSPISSS
jgi:cytochrome P450